MADAYIPPGHARVPSHAICGEFPEFNGEYNRGQQQQQYCGVVIRSLTLTGQHSAELTEQSGDSMLRRSSSQERENDRPALAYMRAAHDDLLSLLCLGARQDSRDHRRARP